MHLSLGHNTVQEYEPQKSIIRGGGGLGYFSGFRDDVKASGRRYAYCHGFGGT